MFNNSFIDYCNHKAVGYINTRSTKFQPDTNIENMRYTIYEHTQNIRQIKRGKKYTQ